MKTRRFFFGSLSLSAISLLVFTASARAATFYWDQLGLGAGGGTGAWDTTSSFWRPGSLAGSLGTYGNATTDGVVLGGTAGTLTIATGGVNANNITFQTTGYTIAGGANALTLSGTGPVIDTGVFNATISATVAGTVGFTKLGSGTLTLNTTANTWTGMAYVNAGTLSVQTAQAATATFALNNGAALTTNQTLSATNTATILSGSSTITGTTNSAFLGAYLGSGNVTWNGGATNQTNYNSNLWANFGGTFTFGNNSGGRLNSALIRGEYATIDLGSGTSAFYSNTSGAVFILGAAQGSGTGTTFAANNTSGNTDTFIIGSANSNTTFAGLFSQGNGNVGGFSALTKVGTGTLTLTGASTTVQAGNLLVNGGTLKLDYGTNSTGIWKSTATLGFGGGALSLQGKSTGTSTQTLGAVTVNAGGSSLIVDNNNGSGTTLTLGAITATAAGGTLNILSPSVSLVGTAGTITTTSVLSTNGTSASTSIYSPRLTYGTNWATGATSGVSTLSAYNSYADLSTSIGTTSVTTNNRLNDVGSATMTGNLTVNTLKIANSTSQSLDLGGNAVQVTAGGLLFSGSAAYGIGSSVNNGTLKSFTATNSDLIIQQLGTGNLTINSVIANGNGASTLTKAGSGTLTLAGTNTYTGATFLNGGITSISANMNLGAFATGATLNLNGGTLQSTGASVTLDNAGANKRLVTIGGGGGTFEVTASNILTVSGVISNAVANQFGPLVKTGSGTLTLTGANSYNGQTIINGGTISVATVANAGSNSTLGNANQSAPGLVLNGGTLLTTGAAGSTDRSFTVGANGGTISSSGTGALTFSNITNTLATGSGNRTLTLTGSYAATDNSMSLAIADPTSGATSVTKAGAAGSTWVLGNVNNTYTGTTTVSAGTLKLTNATSSNNIASSATIAVNSGSTLNVNGLLNSRIILSGGQILTGSGTVSGAVAAASGSILTPGDSGVGTLTLGSLTLSAGSLTNFEFTNGSTYDVVSVTSGGGLLLNGGNFNLFATGTPNQWLTTGTYNLFNYTGADPSVAALNAQAHAGVQNFNLGLTYAWTSGSGLVTLTIGGTPTVISTWTGSSGGIWNTGANWNTDPSIPSNSGDSASFTTAAGGGTVDFGATSETLGVLNFNSTAAYTLSGSGGVLNFNNGSGNAAQLNDITSAGSNTIAVPVTLTADGLTVGVTNSGETLNVTGAISGAGKITKNGVGTLALAGGNSYGPASGTVGTTLNAGTLQVGNSSALSTGDLAVTASSTLQAGASVNLANNIIIGLGNTLTVDSQPNTLTLSGVLGQTGATAAVTKIGSGTLKLSGTNTYTGTTTITNGTLQLGDAGITGSVAGNIVNNAALTLNRTDDYSLGNVISGTGSLTQAGTDIVTLIAANNFTGNTVVSAGTLKLGTALALQNSTLNYNNQGGTFSFGTLTAANLGGLTGAQNLDLTNSTPAAVALTVGGNNDVTTYTGLMGGLGSLNKTGTGVLTIGSGASGGATYSGTTTTAGTLTLGGVTNVTGQFFAPNGGNLTFADTAVVNTGANGLIMASVNFTGGTITVKDSSQVSFASLTFGNTGTQQTPGNFVTVRDSATLSITGALDLNASNGSNNSASNTALNLNGGITTIGGITASTTTAALHQSTVNFNGGELRPTASSATFLPVLTGQTSKVLAGGAKINTNSFDITIGATLTSGVSGDGGLTKSGAGTLTLTGANSYNGITTINAGTLNINGQFALGGAVYGGANFNGGTLQYATAFSGNGTGDISQNSGGTTKPVTIRSGGATIDTNGNTVTYAKTIGAGGTGGLTLNDTAGTPGSLILAAAATYTGATTITAGTLQLGNGGTTGSLATGSTIANNGNLTIKRSNAVGQGTDFSAAAITGTGGFTQAGSGITTLTAANTYTGPTLVTGGTLLFNGSSVSGSAVTVQNVGSTVGGTGTIGGSVAVGSQAILAAGDSSLDAGVETLAAGSVSLESGSIFAWDLNGNTDSSRGVAGGYDGLDVTGELAIDSGAIFRVVLGAGVGTDSFWTSAHTWNDIFSAGSVTGSGFVNSLLQVVDSAGGAYDLDTLNPGSGYGFTINGTTLSWSAVPEPTSALAGLLLGAGLLRRNRRQVSVIHRRDILNHPMNP